MVSTLRNYLQLVAAFSLLNTDGVSDSDEVVAPLDDRHADQRGGLQEAATNSRSTATVRPTLLVRLACALMFVPSE